MFVAETIVFNKSCIDYFPIEEPTVLQLGGSDVDQMSEAAKYAVELGYKHINLNCGCPSDRVMGKGCFGAALMRQKHVVKALMNSISQ